MTEASNASQDRLGALISARFATPQASPSNSGANDTSFIETMLSHRTCRSFTADPVADDLIELVLAATSSTPSKSDLQQWSVIEIDDPAIRSTIGELIPMMPWIVTAPRFFVFCGDSRRIRRVTAEAGKEFGNDHLDAFLNAASDAAMHLSSFVWAAESLGLGTCPISVVRNHIEEVAELLALPAHVFPLAGMCVGWPERLELLSPRLPHTVTVHRDRYDDRDLTTQIQEYDRRRLAAQPGSKPWSRAKAAMVARSERSQLARFLRSQGFGLD